MFDPDKLYSKVINLKINAAIGMALKEAEKDGKVNLDDLRQYEERREKGTVTVIERATGEELIKITSALEGSLEAGYEVKITTEYLYK